MNRTTIAAVILTGLLVVPGVASGQPSTPQVLRVQGFLSDGLSGSPVPANGPYSMTFRLFDDEFAGLLLATAGPQTVDVTEGVYQVELPFPSGLFDGTERYLEIEVEDELLAPRLKVVSAPFAYMAEKVGGFAATDLEESAEIDTKIADHDAAPGAHPSLEESAEIVAAVAAHESATDPHTAYVNRAGDSMSGALSIDSPAPDTLALSAPGEVRLSFSSDGGPAHSLNWNENEGAFALSDGLDLDNAKLLRWPMSTGPSAGVATYSFSKLATTPPGQDQHPDGENDETFQFCYNCRADGSTFQADPDQHAWNQKFEANYWNSVANHEQLEVNWNYTDPAGFKRRPFAFVLQITANCRGGSLDGNACITAQEIAACASGGGVCEGDNWAQWDWEASALGICSLDHSIRCRTADECPGGSCHKASDMALEQGRGRVVSRQGILVDTFQPGTAWASSYSAIEVLQDVEPVDTSTPFYGLKLDSSFTAAAAADSAPTSWLGVRARQVFGGAAPTGRFVSDRMTGVEVRQELSQTAVAGQSGGGFTVPELSGLSWKLTPNGTNLSVGSAAGLRLETPDSLAGGASEVFIGELDGLRIDDLRGYGVANHALRVASQSGDDGGSGNIHMEGGGATDGHLSLGDGHLWFDPATGLFRSKDGSGGAAPTSDADGSPLHAPTGMSVDWGEALWGSGDGAVNTGTKVCDQAGLSCVGAFGLTDGRERNCGYSNWSGTFFVAFCR